MPLITVQDASDARIAEYAAIRDKALWRDQGLFVAEGRLVVRRTVEHHADAVRSVVVSPAALEGLQDVIGKLAPDVAVLVCPPAVLATVAGFQVHRGCVALVRRPPENDPWALVKDARLLVVLEALTDADNVGVVFRNAAAFEVDAVLLSPECCDPLYRKAIRTSMAATLCVPFARLDNWPEHLNRLAEFGFTIVAMTPQGEAESLDGFATTCTGERRLAIMFGTEGRGLSRAAMSHATRRLRIPLAAAVDSLNVGVAAGIALFRLSRLTRSGLLR